MSALKRQILTLIRDHAPISIAEYMTLALYHPERGYYMTRDPFGAPRDKGGDFITAPEVSQIFGELIGAFFVQVWEDRGRPERFYFVELGPGRGTLMADMLRAARVRPAFIEAAQVTLVEISPKLRAVQEKTLAGHKVRWARWLGEITNDAPMFLVANEFFDALPVRQYVKANDGWHERLVGMVGRELAFALAPLAAALPEAPDAPDGVVFEISPTSRAIASMVATGIAKGGGAALFIDYGHAQSGLGDTFQAARAHRFADPLAEPGEADLTAHVDFAALADAARKAGAHVHGPVTQQAFLESLGIVERAAALSLATPDQAADIKGAIDRLTGKDQMGCLFKILSLSDRATPPTGFPC